MDRNLLFVLISKEFQTTIDISGRIHRCRDRSSRYTNIKVDILGLQGQLVTPIGYITYSITQRLPISWTLSVIETFYGGDSLESEISRVHMTSNPEHR